MLAFHTKKLEVPLGFLVWVLCATKVLLNTGGKQIILYGGEGHEMIDGAGGQPPNVYTMDIASLTWHKRSTTCTTVDESPGVRSLHIVTVTPLLRELAVSRT